MNHNDKILIIGAGLCGSLLALRLAQRGFEVEIYESRPDIRTTDTFAGRSINLALSNRGLQALRMVGVEERALEICIPMYGRLIHNSAGNLFESSYSGRGEEYISSISRSDLNSILLTEAEKHENVNIHFNVPCVSIDVEHSFAIFQEYKTKQTFTVKADVIFGTDGVGSILRKSYEKLDFDFKVSQEFLTHGYKELEIPSVGGRHQISKNHLHIWPRGNYMLIALPNMDGSFTVTLFLSYSEGEFNFYNLKSEKEIINFFREQFPDALELIPNILEEFENNPIGKLGTVKCYPWSYKNSLLLGDAAHAIVPFYGQGMNASFEDVYVLDEVIQQNGGESWNAIFETFQKQRKKDADAIANLAIDNYYEMRDHVANAIFKEKRQVEMALEKNFPKEYFSKYSLVTFKEEIGYHEALTKGRIQDEVLISLIESNKINISTSLEIILEKVKEETARRFSL